jgi:hypothetical protein
MNYKIKDLELAEKGEKKSKLLQDKCLFLAI